MLNRVSTSNAPAAIGPYSQVVWAGNFLYLSGMMPIDPATGGLEPADITLQADRIMKNIEAVLTEAGLNQADVVKTTCFLSDMANFAAFNAVYGEFFTSKPARSCVAVRELPKGALVEVEVIAYKG